MALILPSLAALLLALLPVAALAAPPPNDTASAAASFEPYTTENGAPSEQQAVAELAESTPDAGVPRCLGDSSFARTVWYRVPEAPFARELAIDASGRTLDVLDLAAFVQPEVAPPPPPPQPQPTPPPARRSQSAPATLTPNVCAGLGAGGSDAAEEPTSAITLRVPPNFPVLVQVGRRGPVLSAHDERAVLSLEDQPIDGLQPPSGDRADGFVPSATREDLVDLAHATVTGEDPAVAPCPSLGTVWRRLKPGSSGKRLLVVSGSGASTLTVFAGSRPTRDNLLDCINRERRGSLRMLVPVRKKRTVWIRVGSDDLEAGPALLDVRPGEGQLVIDGGPGGFDPTSGGPGGGFPDACARTRVERARVRGRRLRGAAGSFNRFRRVPLRVRVRGSSICDVELRLLGPRGRSYAKGRAIRLKGSRTVRLPRLRTFRPGRYRLRVTAVSQLGRRQQVRTSLGGRLR